jgi:hypothetical protein
MVQEYRLDSSGSGYDPVVGCCGFIKAREFLDKLNVSPPSKGDSPAWNGL